MLIFYTFTDHNMFIFLLLLLLSKHPIFSLILFTYFVFIDQLSIGQLKIVKLKLENNLKFIMKSF